MATMNTRSKNLKRKNTNNYYKNQGPQMKRARLTRQLTNSVDYKYTDVGALGNVSAAGTVVDLLASLVRGTDSLNNFIGQKINPVGIQMRIQGIGSDITNFMRVLIFQWFDSVAPAPLGILQTLASYNSAIAVTNKENITVLYDRIFKSQLAFVASTSVFDMPTKTIYIPGGNMLPIEFKTGAVGAQKGGLYMLVLSDSVAPLHPSVDYYSRVTFTDV